MLTTSTGIPRLGLGTYGRTGADGLAALRTAIELGYRHFDTAQTYDTESGVGEAIRQSGLPRGDFFITTKIADTKLQQRDFIPSLRHSLERIGVDRVELTLVHWPSHRDAVPFAEYMDALVEARALGLTRLIGVSNFPAALVDRAVAIAGVGEIATNQVELHPFLQSRSLSACCARHGIPITAYMPLAGGRVTADPVLQRIAGQHGVAPSTITLAWLLQRGRIVIPSSANRAHLAANLRAATLALTPAERLDIDALDRGERIINPGKSPAWD